MQRIIAVAVLLLMSAMASADVQQRMTIFTQQAELFRQICFAADGTFQEGQIIFDANSSISETAIDCNAQAHALEAERLAIEAVMQDDDCPSCYQTINDQGLIGLLNGTSGVVAELSCPGIGDANQCMAGLACNLITSVIPMGAAAARLALRNHPTLSSCGSGGNCFSNIGKAIWDNLWDTVRGLYDLGSMTVNWAGDRLGSLFAAEDATSTRGIAATEVNEDQLSLFLADPIGFLHSLGGQLLNMITRSISERYGCAEWTGEPHLSECIQPMSWECANCNEKLNMVCGVTSYIGATVITTFFTGGATAIAQIGGKLATTSVIAVARNIPGASRIAQTMATAGKLTRVGGVITGTVRSVWASVMASRSVQAISSVVAQLGAAGARANAAIGSRVFLYASTQTAVIEAARAYNRLHIAAFNLGYRSTGQAADATQAFLYARYPRLRDITEGRYNNVATPADFLRESTAGMSPAEQSFMRVAVTTDGAGQQRIVIFDSRADSIDSDITFNFSPSRPPPPPVAPVIANEVTAVDEIVVTAVRRPTVTRVLFMTAEEAETTFRGLQAFGVELPFTGARALLPEVADRLSDRQRIYLVEEISGKAIGRTEAPDILAAYERRASAGANPELFAERQARVRRSLEASGMSPDEAAEAAEQLFRSGALGRTPPPEQISLIVRNSRAAPSATSARAADDLTSPESPPVSTVTPVPFATPAVVSDFRGAWGTRTATTEAENIRFIAGTHLGRQPGLFYLDAQNTILKRLNDTLGDKTLINAFGNRYNAMVQDALASFRRAHPGVQIDMYSDYKSFRAAIRGPPGQEDALMAELAGIMDRTGAAFVAEMRASGLVETSILDGAWFRAGLGRTADEANLVTRFSRRSSDGPEGTSTFDDPELRSRITHAWQIAQTTRAQIANRFRGTDLVRSVEGSNNLVPTADVLEVIRKNPGDAAVARILSARYGVRVRPADATRFRTYFNQVDQFSPGLMIARRVEHRFDLATEGGFTIDFAGVGSFNAEATAIGLTDSNELLGAISAVRRREAVVTEALDALKVRTETAIETVLERHGITATITISGDDMLVVPSRPLSPAIRQELAEAQARVATDPSGIRTSFFPEGMADEVARSVQATLGETIEKKLRYRLETLLPRADLRQTLFALEMHGTTPGAGAVSLRIINTDLSPAAREIIQREFSLAISDVNNAQIAAGNVGTLTTAP